MGARGAVIMSVTRLAIFVFTMMGVVLGLVLWSPNSSESMARLMEDNTRLRLLLNEMTPAPKASSARTTQEASVQSTAAMKVDSNESLMPYTCPATVVPAKYAKVFDAALDTFTPFHEFFAKMSNADACKECPLAHKWYPYFDAYDDMFKRYRNKKIVFMEIGVQSGGSIAMWRAYFGKQLHYIGLDINEETRRFADADRQIDIHIGDTGNVEFLNKIRNLYPDGVDILLDDGGHTMQHQITNFQTMFNFVNSNGIFACEDLGTSYHRHFGGIKGGTVSNPRFVAKTMMGRVHLFIDWLHAGFSTTGNVMDSRTQKQMPTVPGYPDYASFVSNFKAIHVYNQIVFLQRGTFHQGHIMTAGVSIPYGGPTTKYSGYKLPWEKIDPQMESVLQSDPIVCTTP